MPREPRPTEATFFLGTVNGRSAEFFVTDGRAHTSGRTR